MKVDQKTANPESVGQEAVVNETSAPNPAKRSNAKKKKGASGELIFWRITSSLLLLAVITLAVMLHLSKAGMLPEPEEEAPAEAASGYTAWCYAPVGEPQTVAADEDGTVKLPQGPQIDGYTFLGWKDSDGNPVAGDTVTLYADAAYSAEYAIAFRDGGLASHHAAYLITTSRSRARRARSSSCTTVLTQSLKARPNLPMSTPQPTTTQPLPHSRIWA